MALLMHLFCIVDCDEILQWDMCRKACIGFVGALRNYLTITKDYTSIIHKSQSNIWMNNYAKAFMQ